VIPENVKVLEFDMATLSLIQLEDISSEKRFIRLIIDEIDPKDLLEKISTCKNIQMLKEEKAYFKSENE